MKTKNIFALFIVCGVLLTGCSHKSETAISGSNAFSSAETSGASSQADSVTGAGGESSAAVSVPGGTVSNPVKPASSKTGQSSTSKAASAPSKTASSQPQGRKTVNVMIPEGYSLSQIAGKLEASKVCSKSSFLATAITYNFSYYSLIGALPNDPNRCYKLEGYLYPNTYQFYENMKPQDAIGIMLRGAQTNIGSKYSYPGMTTDQVVTLASLIQKEAANYSDMTKVSSVFHNRLKAHMKLWADSTIYYIERYVKPNLTGDINRYNSYYNTQKCSALPEGPICNPGKLALEAAANPDNTNYLFFVADKSGHYLFASTYSEHLKNCQQAGISPSSAQQSN